MWNIIGDILKKISTNPTGRFEVKAEKSETIPRFETLELSPIPCHCLNF